MTEADQDALAEAYHRALDLEKQGDHQAAAELYRRVLELDPEDSGGASIRLAAMGLADAPDKMPDAYVSTLFDQHADVFDAILVDQLDYCVPLLLREQIRRLDLGPFSRMLDLGCGTGLTGVAFAGHTDHLTGVDLSEAIVEVAFDREVYDDLYVGEAVEFLSEFEEDDGSRPSWSMIAATDVFPYVGAVEPFMEEAAGRLDPGGLLSFSTETLPQEVLQGRNFMIGPKQRFAHDLAYIRQALTKFRFAELAADPITVRLEDGEPVPGHLVTARLTR